MKWSGKCTPARGSYPELVVHGAACGHQRGDGGRDSRNICRRFWRSQQAGLPSLSSSTNSFATAAVINGPIRDKLNMNYGIGAMGPFRQPNAAIGRAWTMVSRNLGDSGIPGQTYLGTLGNSVNYNNLIIRGERKGQPVDSPSRAKGLQARENVVSVFVGFSISQGQGGIGLGVKPVPQYHEALRYNCIPFGPLFGALVFWIRWWRKVWSSSATKPRSSSPTGCRKIRLFPRRTRARHSSLAAGFEIRKRPTTP